MKKFRYKFLANIFFALHIFWIVLLLGGIGFMSYHRWYIVYHLIIVSGTLLANLFLGGCPFTWWEDKYRKLYDPNIYYDRNSFIVTYVHKIFGWKVLPVQVDYVLIVIKVFSYAASVLLLTRFI